MKFQSAFVIAALTAASTSAFQVNPSLATPTSTGHSNVKLALQNQPQEGEKTTKTNPLASLAVAGTIFATSLATSVVAPPVANADVELSTGAVIIQTTTKPGQSVLKAEVDVKDLLGTLIKNRKPIKESIGRITTVIKEELKQPVWADLSKELLQIEGDVTPELTVQAPRELQQTLRDLSQGKLNLIVNGEIINLSVEKSTSAAEDDLVIRAKGVKGIAMPSFAEPATSQVRTRLEDQIDAINEFWYQPLPIPDSIQKSYNLQGYKPTVGDAILGGGIVGIGGVYGISYAYYINQQEEAAAKLEAQKKKKAEMAKKKAAAVKKDKEEEAEKSSEKTKPRSSKPPAPSPPPPPTPTPSPSPEASSPPSPSTPATNQQEKQDEPATEKTEKKRTRLWKFIKSTVNKNQDKDE